MSASMMLHRVKGLRAGVTMIETLLVLFLIAIVVSLILPSLAQTRFNTRTLMCQNNMREIGRGFMDFAQSNKQKLPGNTDDRPPSYNYAEASWLYCSVKPSYYTTFNPAIRQKSSPTNAQFLQPAYAMAPDTGTLFEFTRHKKIYRCPSMEVGVVGSGRGSNGLFDYGMLNALYGARIDRLPVQAYFSYVPNPADSTTTLTPTTPYLTRMMPIIVEEDAAQYVNNLVSSTCCIEADFSNNDLMANVHRRVGIGQPGVAANYIASDCSVQLFYRENTAQYSKHIWSLNTKFGTINYLGFVGPAPVGQWDNGVYSKSRPQSKSGSAYGTWVPRAELPVEFQPFGAP
jgi:type II secretory pathway pseudopilin PulG